MTLSIYFRDGVELNPRFEAKAISFFEVETQVLRFLKSAVSIQGTFYQIRHLGLSLIFSHNTYLRLTFIGISLLFTTKKKMTFLRWSLLYQ